MPNEDIVRPIEIAASRLVGVPGDRPGTVRVGECGNPGRVIGSEELQGRFRGVRLPGYLRSSDDAPLGRDA